MWGVLLVLDRGSSKILLRGLLLRWKLRMVLLSWTLIRVVLVAYSWVTVVFLVLSLVVVSIQVFLRGFEIGADRLGVRWLNGRLRGIGGGLLSRLRRVLL